MSSSVCAHRLLLTKETIRHYKYNNIIMRRAADIRDTVCRELERCDFSCEKQTKYVCRLDDYDPIYRFGTQFHDKSRIHMDLVQQLQYFFPDSKITVEEREQINGFTVTHQTYIEVDWS